MRESKQGNKQCVIFAIVWRRACIKIGSCSLYTRVENANSLLLNFFNRWPLLRSVNTRIRFAEIRRNSSLLEITSLKEFEAKCASGFDSRAIAARKCDTSEINCIFSIYVVVIAHFCVFHRNFFYPALIRLLSMPFPKICAFVCKYVILLLLMKSTTHRKNWILEERGLYIL